MGRKGLLRAVEIKSGVKWVSGQKRKRKDGVTVADLVLKIFRFPTHRIL